MSEEDKKIEMAKEWIKKESSKGNVLAESYSSLLSNANDGIKRHYYLALSDTIEVAKAIAQAVKESN